MGRWVAGFYGWEALCGRGPVVVDEQYSLVSGG